MQGADQTSAAGSVWWLEILRFRAQDRPQRPRFAFLVANWNYRGDAELRNPPNDVNAVEEALSELDFDISRHDNLNTKSTFFYLERFIEKAKAAAEREGRGCDVLIYYSGHGIQLARGSEIRNYIVPVSFDPEDPNASSEADLVCVQDVLARIEFAVHRFVFLDACRDDGGFSQGGLAVRVAPQEGSISADRSAGMAPRPASRGFSPPIQRLRLPPIADNTLIAYAADPGAFALDGDGDRSPFTTAVCRHIRDFNLDVMDLMQSVTQSVRSDAAKRGQVQIPWVNTNITGSYSFRNVGRRPVHALGTLGLLSGIVTALFSFSILQPDQPFGIGKPNFVNVGADPSVLATSAGMAITLAIGVWYWGAREAWKALATGILYFAVAVFLRLWFAHKNPMQHYLGLCDAAGGCSEPTKFELGVYIVQAAALGGAATIAAGYFFVPALRSVPRLLSAAAIGAAAGILFEFHEKFASTPVQSGLLGAVIMASASYFLLARMKWPLFLALTVLGALSGTLIQEFFNAAGAGEKDLAHAILVLLLVAAWQAAIGINLGYAFMRYRPGSDDRWIGRRYFTGRWKS